MFDGLFEIHLFEQVDGLVSVEGELVGQEGNFLLANFPFPT